MAEPSATTATDALNMSADVADTADQIKNEADDANEADNDDEEAIPADEIRQLANAHFARSDFEVALPLYSAAVDAARLEDEEWARGERESGYQAAVDAAAADDAGEGSAANGSAADGGAAANGTGRAAAASQDRVAAEGEDDDDDDDDDPTYYREPAAVLHLCNRSACLFKMERYEEARNDAREAVELCKGRNSKAWFRLARSQMSMRQYNSAVDTLEAGLRNLDREERDLTRQEEELEEGEAPLCMDDDDDEGDGKEDGAVAERTAELEAKRKNLQLQRRELTKLLTVSRKKRTQLGQDAPDPSTLEPPVITSIKLEPRKPSIREFELLKEIGVGNFSRIVICKHRTTGEEFALKIIEKKKAEQLAKRQHPNVYNEIQMERRILAERIPGGHPRIVRLYHAIQDYGNLYMLTELHSVWGDLWSQLRDKGRMVGCHPSCARLYLSELLDAVEFLHSRGIVHRDLKPENVVLSDRGHVVLLDLGTAKDMVLTDLNGPEFVGTPDYMSPEMVKGTSSDREVGDARRKGKIGADHTADLWALGCIAYQMCTGYLPFAAPSPYLAFLRIQRGNLLRPWGVADDDNWDFVRSLLRVDPRERLGADCFDFTDAAKDGLESSNAVEDSKEEAAGFDEASSETRPHQPIAEGQFGVGYDIVRRHPYFQKGVGNGGFTGTTSTKENLSSELKINIYAEQTPVPSLHDLCIRAVAEQVRLDSLDLDSDRGKPGGGSAHDMLRLNEADRRYVMHYLDRHRILSKPRAFRRFFASKVEARLGRVRPGTADCVGLTQLHDGMGQFPTKDCQENADPHMKDLAEVGDPIQFVRIKNPLFIKKVNERCDDGTRKVHIESLKDSIRKTNRTRPKLAVAVGYFDAQCRKLLAKVNETIPVVLCETDGPFFSFWVCGAQCLFVRSGDFIDRDDDGDGEDGGPAVAKESNGVDAANAQGVVPGCAVDQSAWLSEQLEQSRTAGHHLFVFADCDPRKLPEELIRKFARGKTLCLYGICDDGDGEGEGGGSAYESEYVFEVRKEDKGDEDGDGEGGMEAAATAEKAEGDDDDDDDDDLSVESQDEKSHTMKIMASNSATLCRVTLEEYGVWEEDEL